MHRIPAKPEPLHRARAEILDQHIGVAHEVLRDRQPIGRFRVDADAALVAIEIREEAGGEAVQPAGAVAVRRRLHADHVGAEIGENDAAGRAHHRVAEFQYDNVFERQDRHRNVPTPRKISRDQHRSYLFAADVCQPGRAMCV